MLTMTSFTPHVYYKIATSLYEVNMHSFITSQIDSLLPEKLTDINP